MDSLDLLFNGEIISCTLTVYFLTIIIQIEDLKVVLHILF